MIYDSLVTIHEQLKKAVSYYEKEIGSKKTNRSNHEENSDANDSTEEVRRLINEKNKLLRALGDFESQDFR